MKTYRVYYVDLTERSYIVDAENKKDAETKAKKKLGKIRITESKLKK